MTDLMETCDHAFANRQPKAHWPALAGVAIAAAALLSCGGGEKGNMTAVQDAVPAEIMGWKASDTTETYNRETIFDYIDGAGEVYRSYDFREVTVWRFTKAEQPEIMVEVFDMGKPEDAYGVFSYTRESEQTGLGGGYEQRGGVVCFWQNRYYVCVAAYESTEQSAEAVMALAHAVSSRLPAKSEIPVLVRLLPEHGRLAGSERFFHLASSLNYHYFLAEKNILMLSGHTDVAMATYDEGQTYLLCVEYPDQDDAAAARLSFVENYAPEAAESGSAVIDDKWISLAAEGRYLIVVLDGVSKDRATALVNEMKLSLADAATAEEDRP